MLYVLLDNYRTWLVDKNVYWMFMVFDQLMFRALAAAALSLFAVLVLGKPVIRWLRRKKIGDTGLADTALLQDVSKSKANVPTMGGILICSAIFCATALLADVRNFYVVVGLIVLLWLAALGSFDDWLKLTAASRPGGSRQGLYAWEKLIFQLGLGALVGWFVYDKGDAAGVTHHMAHVLNIPFQATYTHGPGGGMSSAFVPSESLFYLPKIAFVIVALLMVAGMSNAVNITDGMDGLATGTTTIVSLGLVVLTFIAGKDTVAQFLLVPFVDGSHEVMVLVAAITGASLGFLWWNCSPAQVFMGDTGSLALGGLLGYVAVVIRQEALLLLMCGVFLMEIASVVLQVGYFKYTRKRTGVGQRLFKVAPIHHHFHILGWTEQTVVARFWIITSILVIAALALVKLR